MDRKKLGEKLIELGEPKFRLKQILKAVYEDGVLDFGDISTLSQNLREKLGKEVEIFPMKVGKVLVSRDKKSIKALLEMKGGNLIETVLLSPKPGLWSACVSCQVGCLLGCAFCATGKGGFKRNLVAEEIESQVLFWKNYLRVNKIEGALGNIVYMGMGEPFLNFKEVAKSLEDLTDPELFGFGSRSISVSTSGVMDKWIEFAEKFPQINLALSLHSADQGKRDRIMPISQKFNLESIRKTLREYLAKHKRKVFIEYILLSGFNDSARDAGQLSEFLKSIGKAYLLHVNLIRYNFTPTPKGTVISNNKKNV
ncbi:MAG: 23S rRNA (adenine(2503)-C(2))-methyltransferase RlmN, partial [Patescibacteria group bacterium]